MTDRRSGVRRMIQAAFLAAIGLSTAACSRGPATVVPTPRAERWWQDLHRRHLDRAKQGRVDLLFLGDSITQRWNDNKVWRRSYEPRHAANLGIDGDATQHVLWRIEHGELEGIRPKVVVLLIGTNNLSDATPAEIAQGVAAIVAEVEDRLPDSRVLLLGIFPRGEKPDATREKIRTVNARLARLADGGRVRYLDIGPSFLDDDGTISREIMPDFLHLSVEGYQTWADAMEPTLRTMLGGPGPADGAP